MIGDLSRRIFIRRICSKFFLLLSVDDTELQCLKSGHHSYSPVTISVLLSDNHVAILVLAT